jgi:hypothetical protein
MTFSAFVVRRWLSSYIARTYRPSMSTRRYELKSSHIRYLVLISCRIPLHRVPSIRAGVISTACRLTRPGVLRRGNVSIGSVCVSHTDFMLFTIPCVHDYGRPDVLPDHRVTASADPYTKNPHPSIHLFATVIRSGPSDEGVRALRAFSDLRRTEKAGAEHIFPE